jgi:hypothetical protein
MPKFSASQIGGALAAFIVLTPATVGAADQPPPYPSATEAYRQGASFMKSGEMASAVPALEVHESDEVLSALNWRVPFS